MIIWRNLMKNVLKRALSAALAAVILSAVFSSFAAADDNGCHVWIGDEYITKDNAADVFGDGTVSFDPDTNTLTLNGFSYSGEGAVWTVDEKTNASAIVYDGDRDLTLVLLGDNSITHPGGHDYSSCVFSSSKITIKGTGSLTGTSGKANNVSYAVYGMKGIITDGGTVKAYAGVSTGDSVGLYSGEELIINGGTVTAEGGAESDTSIGIYGKTGITVNGGDITAATKAGSKFSAAMLGGSITVNNGKVTAKGGDGEYSAGSYSKGCVLITGGDITSVGGTAKTYSDGIYCNEDFTVSGGNVAAVGGTAEELSSGLFLAGETAQINGGSVTLEGGEGKTSRGINETFSEKKEIRIGDGITSVTITGRELALGGTLISAVGGVGSGEDGEEKGYIVPGTDLSEPQYKTVVFPHAHEMTKTEAKKPSTRETGNIEYYACSGCDSYFEDADGKILIPDKNSVLIPALGEEDVVTVPENKFPWLWVIIPAVTTAAAAAVIIVIIKKKSKTDKAV